MLGASFDDVLGIVSVADVRDLDPARRHLTPAQALAIPAGMLPKGWRCRRCWNGCAPNGPDVLSRGAHVLARMTEADEYGGFAGILTLEDLAEELVQ